MSSAVCYHHQNAGDKFVMPLHEDMYSKKHAAIEGFSVQDSMIIGF